ncbi:MULTISPECIES: hypothetical protein [Streptomyces]|uniref:Uncharacterized protein n=2 Tax=Streptomyces TaxID=1883 RepID=A0A5N5ZXI3_9ACTN|nr:MULTISPECIES: hypothetical protein [Streptomyces]KAB8161214.1 hypothetical protein FH607_026640 [Streptomyces mimosae]KAB8179025.1 hypothetical protein FH609_003470 [Streptomyces sp. 3MP-14]RMI44632.1 hypothetical protein EBN88_04870 [Streptomyces triticirhizae]
MENGERAAWERRPTARVVPAARPRKVVKVPFVELVDGRLQGVVSSGSDIARVYVSAVEAGSHDVSCGTNNNRPCGGIRPGGCKHVEALVKEAVLQYGEERVARFLRVEPGEGELTARLRGGGINRDRPAAEVFSRFLRHLAYLEVPASTAPLPELRWFPATGAVR